MFKSLELPACARSFGLATAMILAPTVLAAEESEVMETDSAFITRSAEYPSGDISDYVYPDIRARDSGQVSSIMSLVELRHMHEGNERGLEIYGIKHFTQEMTDYSTFYGARLEVFFPDRDQIIYMNMECSLVNQPGQTDVLEDVVTNYAIGTEAGQLETVLEFCDGKADSDFPRNVQITVFDTLNPLGAAILQGMRDARDNPVEPIPLEGYPSDGLAHGTSAELPEIQAG